MWCAGRELTREAKGPTNEPLFCAQSAGSFHHRLGAVSEPLDVRILLVVEPFQRAGRAVLTGPCPVRQARGDRPVTPWGVALQVAACHLASTPRSLTGAFDVGCPSHVAAPLQGE